MWFAAMDLKRELMPIGYRLYTVLPRLVQFIDRLTNCYIRFNRNRLKVALYLGCLYALGSFSKGECGHEDEKQSLAVLFEVLYTLSKMMAAFAPFLSEYMYQHLRPMVKNETGSLDLRSVHFIMFPEPRMEYFDEQVERAVARMLVVIELARVIRERKTLALKVCCLCFYFYTG